MRYFNQFFDKRNYLSTNGLIKTLLCGVFLLLPFSITSFAPHPYHVSHTEIVYKAESNTLTFAIEVFTDDLEQALKLQAKEEKIFLGSDSVPAFIESHIQTYIKNNLSVYTGALKQNNFQFLPTESNPDRTHIYFFMDDLPAFSSFTFASNLLISSLPDQQNIIEFIVGDMKKKELFNKELRQQTWNING